MLISLKQIRNFILIIAFGLVCGRLGYWLAGNKIKIDKQDNQLPSIQIFNKTVPADKNLDFNLFWQVWEKLEEKYYDREAIQKDKMFYGAIQGLTASLGDPYTIFLPPLDNKSAKEDLNGSFEGVGIKLDYKDGNRIVVTAPLKGSPAETAGVQAGDWILHIKDEKANVDIDTFGLTLPQVVEKIRGPKGTKIILTLQHENEDKSYVAAIIRGEIVVPSVEVEFLDAKDAKESAKVAHLKLSRFGELTSKQWDDSVQKINNEKLKIKNFKGVILDVRGNPGGYLSGAVSLVSEFLDKGVVVKQENYKGEVESYSVNRRGQLLDVPLVVLIDKGSASASEILAGALRDHNRAKLIGATSFGKGTIQEAEDLTGGAGLHITTAKWLTPNGTWVHKTGLKPDFEVENDPNNKDEDKQLDKAIEVLTKN